MATHHHYRLMVAGELDAALRDHFGGAVTCAGAFTIYDFYVADQTNLHGILAHLRDHDIPIVQLVCTDHEAGAGNGR
jgi:hypothetical protein